MDSRHSASASSSSASPFANRPPYAPGLQDDHRGSSQQYHHSPFAAHDRTGAPISSAPFASQHHRHPSDSHVFHHHHHSSSTHAAHDYHQPHHEQVTAHSRNHSTSSLPTSRDFDNRAMPPPNSPPQQGLPHPPHHSQQQHPHPPHHAMGPYSQGPPPPRAPPLAVGPPSSFPSGGRDSLPALSSIARAPAGSSMSISSMLGGPSSRERDHQQQQQQQQPQHQPQHQQQAPPYPPHSSAPPPASGPGFAAPIHASPRMSSASADYTPFRRPQTPDHQRPYDPRNSAAPSPRGAYGTPDVPRYGTPQSYHARHPSASADLSRDSGRLSAGAPPPRPSSQPKAYPGMPSRPPVDASRPPFDDRYGRRDEASRPPPGAEYNPERTGLRPGPYDDRFRIERERAEMEQREMERRERAYSGNEMGRHSMHPQDMREPPRTQVPYGRPADPRDGREPWARPGSDPSFRAPMDHQRAHPDYPPTSAPYAHHSPVYQPAPADRYGPPGPQHAQLPPGSHPQPYESPERARMGLPHSQAPQGPRLRPGEKSPPPPSIVYNHAQGPAPTDAQRLRQGEDTGPLNHQRNLLMVQENRKGRVSPLPQAVQGVQPQQPGPAAEPGIKSEFGRMFSGIGSGVGTMGLSSPIASGASGPFTNASLAKRDEVDSSAADSAPDGNGNGNGSGKAQKGRRRKLKDEGADDDNSERLTPGAKAKRVKGQQHHHQYVQPGGHGFGAFDDVLFTGLTGTNSHHHAHGQHHHHHHHAHDGGAAQGSAPFKNLKGGTPVPPSSDKNGPGPYHHHHHHHHGGRVGQGQTPKPVQEAPPVMPPKPSTKVNSSAVLQTVANQPRNHLGDFIYEVDVKASRLVPTTATTRGYTTTPKPLPWSVIEGKLNCTLTVKVPRVHLATSAMEEITSRGYLWGTDVYSDDSDVVAACIHSGWIKGEWPEDLDITMADIDVETDKRRKGKNGGNEALDPNSEGIIAKCPNVPMTVPPNRDLHVNIVILPKLVKYGGSTRFGITSREFGGEHGPRNVRHDGLSFQVLNVRWVANGAKPQARLRGKARRERMRKAMQEVKGTFGNVNGEKTSRRTDEVVTEIPGNWFRKNTDGVQEPEQQKERQPSEGDKENHVDGGAAAQGDENKEDAPGKGDVAMEEATEQSVKANEGEEAERVA